MKRILLFLLISLCAVTMVFAQGGTERQSEKKTKVVFWNGYTGSDRPVLEKIVENYNSSQDKIEIVMEIMPWDTLFQKLMPAMIAGNAPDLIGISVTRYAEYAESGKLYALDDFIASSDKLNTSDLVPGLIRAGNYNGKQYVMPMAFAAEVMYYNKDMFRSAGLDPENPPQTIYELQDAWSKLIIKDANGNITQYAQAIGIKSTVAMMPIFMWMYGADYIKDGKSVLYSKEAIEAMTMIQNAFKEGVSPVGLTGQEADNLFSAGKAAIEFNGAWAINGFRSAGIDLGIAEIPSGINGERKTWGGDSVLAITKDSKVKEEAWDFIEYWNSKDVQRQWSLGTGAPPTRTDMSDDEELLKGNPDIAYFLKSSEYAELFMADNPKSSRIDEEILVPLYENVTRGTQSPEEALKAADSALTTLLNE